MELKLSSICPPALFCMFLLIEPLWNWNYWYGPHAPSSARSFNRTTMELKLSIAPRSYRPRRPFNRTTMELKRVKRWIGIYQIHPFNRTTMELKRAVEHPVTDSVIAFNRTTMELKPGSWCAHSGWRPLLIEPLWNWNTAQAGNRAYLPAFNRTTMELKRFIGHCGCVWKIPFNRTTMELKPVQSAVGPLWRSRLLIEPLWNWNQLRLGGGAKNFFLLIEPLWNWNSAVR